MPTFRMRFTKITAECVDEEIEAESWVEAYEVAGELVKRRGIRGFKWAPSEEPAKITVEVIDDVA